MHLLSKRHYRQTWLRSVEIPHPRYPRQHFEPEFISLFENAYRGGRTFQIVVQFHDLFVQMYISWWAAIGRDVLPQLTSKEEVDSSESLEEYVWNIRGPEPNLSYIQRRCTLPVHLALHLSREFHSASSFLDGRRIAVFASGYAGCGPSLCLQRRRCR
jgi:hypothetical protein